MQRITFMGLPMDSASMDENLDYIEQRISHDKFTQHLVW